MWKWLGPLITKALDNMTVESVGDWGTCFATASVSNFALVQRVSLIPANRVYVLSNVFLIIILNGELGSNNGLFKEILSYVFRKVATQENFP